MTQKIETIDRLLSLESRTSTQRSLLEDLKHYHQQGYEWISHDLLSHFIDVETFLYHLRRLRVAQELTSTTKNGKAVFPLEELIFVLDLIIPRFRDPILLSRQEQKETRRSLKMLAHGGNPCKK